MDADDEEDMAENGPEAPLDEVDRDGIPAEPLKTLLVGGTSYLSWKIFAIIREKDDDTLYFSFKFQIHGTEQTNCL